MHLSSKRNRNRLLVTIIYIGSAVGTPKMSLFNQLNKCEKSLKCEAKDIKHFKICGVLKYIFTECNRIETVHISD